MHSTYSNILKNTELELDQDWRQIKTIDMHTGGEPLRIILDGFPELRGNSVLEYRRYCRENYDYLRKALLFEPRGHADMYGCILTPPNDEGADFGILFLHNEGYSTMCGHAIIAISKLAVSLNWIDVTEGENIIKIDAPCGRITAFIHVVEGDVAEVSFHCVPSFVVGLDRIAEVEGIGKVTYDLAYGGAFYAYVDLNRNNFDFELTPKFYSSLIENGMAIKKAVIAQDKEILHPFESDLSFLYGTIFIGDSKANNHSRNVCVFAEGEVDRCPTGSGVSGRMAIHYARKEINFDESVSIESITGSIFRGSVNSKETFGPFNAIIPRVSGTAYITGVQTFVFDPKDPIKNGFILR